MTVQERHQLLADLGWVHIGGFFYEWPTKNTIYIDEISSRPLDFRLNFVDWDRALKIEFYERNSFEWFPCFEGPVKTVDDIKDLMKIFNIVVA